MKELTSHQNFHNPTYDHIDANIIPSNIMKSVEYTSQYTKKLLKYTPI